eukprot:m.1318973 g.1318973  ORF g.1318973 m.1318973 type:complete len:99 (+) comp24843_c0_seq3:3876-4172(+)
MPFSPTVTCVLCGLYWTVMWLFIVQIKGKKVGKIIFKLFGEAGTQIVKEGHQRCLQVTAPKIAGTAPHGMERPVSVASPQSPQSGVDTSDAKAWHEME